MKKVLKNGMMVNNNIDTNSPEYKNAQAEMYNKILDQSKEDHFYIELTALKIRMKKYLEMEVNNENEMISVHEFYKEMLSITQIKQLKLAEYIGMKANNLGEMFKNGKVNYRTAKIIESIFNIRFSLWLDIQSKNEYLLNSKKSKPFSAYSLDEMLEV